MKKRKFVTQPAEEGAKQKAGEHLKRFFRQAFKVKKRQGEASNFGSRQNRDSTVYVG